MCNRETVADQSDSSIWKSLRFPELSESKGLANPDRDLEFRVDFSGPKLGEAWTITASLDLINRKTVRCLIERGTHISMYSIVPCNGISHCLIEARSLKTYSGK